MNLRHFALVCCSAVAAIYLGLVTFTQPVAGEADSTLQSWVDTAPQFAKRSDITIEQFQKEATNFPPCEEKVTHEWFPSPVWSTAPPIDALRNSCVYAMSSGYFDKTTNAIVPFGGDRLQRLKLDDFTFHPEALPAFAIPGTDKIAFVFDSASTGGTKLRIVNDWTRAFPPSMTMDGVKNIERKLSTNFDFVLKDESGNYVQVDQNGLSYSSGGKWLQISATNRSKLLIDLDTYEVVPYANYEPAANAIFSAVSSDGRYVATTKDLSSFKIYDTQRCMAASGKFVSRNCQSIELFDVLKNALGGTVGMRVSGMKFVGIGDALDVNIAKTDDGVNWSYATYRLSNPSHSLSKYLALGDSYSSGEGAYNYRPETNFYTSEKEFNICHQSLDSYPYLVGSLLKDLDAYGSVACSGSNSEDVLSSNFNPLLYVDTPTYKQHHGSVMGTPRDPQNIFSMNLTGYRPQAAYLSNYQATIATIGIGGNDIGFAHKVEKCIAGTEDCFNSTDERYAATIEIDQWVGRWAAQLERLKVLQPASSKLYAVGYPRVMNPDGVCGVNVQINQFEREMGNRFIDYLNYSLNVAADRAGVKFIDIADAFAWGENDFRLCGNQPGDHAMNGLILGSSRQMCGSAITPGQIRCSETYHPTVYGQLMIASKVYTAIRNDTTGMPTPSKTKTKADEYFRDQFIDGTPNMVSGNLYNYNNLVGSALRTVDFYRGVGQRFTASAATILRQTTGTVQANAPFDIELHSTPTKIGSAVMKSEGDIDGSFTIPSSIEAGYHELHLKIPLIDGTTYDSYEIVYVASTVDDMDGDGVKDEDDSCVIVENSGVDEDHDGVDDACDGYIEGKEASRDDTLHHLVGAGVFTQSEMDRIIASNPSIGLEHAQNAAPAINALAAPTAVAKTPNTTMGNEHARNTLQQSLLGWVIAIVIIGSLAIVWALLKRKLSKRPS